MNVKSFGYSLCKFILRKTGEKNETMTKRNIKAISCFDQCQGWDLSSRLFGSLSAQWIRWPLHSRAQGSDTTAIPANHGTAHRSQRRGQQCRQEQRKRRWWNRARWWLPLRRHYSRWWWDDLDRRSFLGGREISSESTGADKQPATGAGSRDTKRGCSFGWRWSFKTIRSKYISYLFTYFLGKWDSKMLSSETFGRTTFIRIDHETRIIRIDFLHSELPFSALPINFSVEI